MQTHPSFRIARGRVPESRGGCRRRIQQKACLFGLAAPFKTITDYATRTCGFVTTENTRENMQKLQKTGVRVEKTCDKVGESEKKVGKTLPFPVAIGVRLNFPPH